MLFKILEPRSVSYVLAHISVIRMSHVAILMQRELEKNGVCLVNCFTLTALDF